MFHPKKQGVANRGASIRVGRDTEKAGKGPHLCLWYFFTSISSMFLFKFEFTILKRAIKKWRAVLLFSHHCWLLLIIIIILSCYYWQATLRTGDQLQTWIPMLSLPWLLKPLFSGSLRKDGEVWKIMWIIVSLFIFLSLLSLYLTHVCACICLLLGLVRCCSKGWVLLFGWIV